ncbi:MAG TPA: 5-formyltetrahydrofolate cyclo-ligase, partial [Stellaceae bacterium]
MNPGRDPTLWRRHERDRLIAARMVIGAELHRSWSAEVARRLSALLERLPGRVVGLYWPHKAEFDPRPLAEPLIARGRSVALPAIVDRRGPLEYRAWCNDAEM